MVIGGFYKDEELKRTNEFYASFGDGTQFYDLPYLDPYDKEDPVLAIKRLLKENSK